MGLLGTTWEWDMKQDMRGNTWGSWNLAIGFTGFLEFTGFLNFTVFLGFAGLAYSLLLPALPNRKSAN